jgi:hypothetical protein
MMKQPSGYDQSLSMLESVSTSLEAAKLEGPDDDDGGAKDRADLEALRSITDR